MIVNIDTHRVKTLDDVEVFLASSSAFQFTLADREAAYPWIEATLTQLGYKKLGKVEKGLIKTYVEKVTGLSRAQVTRLITQYRKTGRIRDRRGPPAKPFQRRYTQEDIALLAKVDELHGTLSGGATRKICERQYQIFADQRFERLARISNGHLYNLRHSHRYQRHRQTMTKTRPSRVTIGERRKPHPQGKPGYLRVDSVHQGDFDGIKGLYHINAVDELTQMQSLFSVARISERFLVPVLKQLLETFPFVIRGFHSDNGSEYVNHRVAELLEKLRIEFTKSRARQTNDNALVESKNGSVVRKHFGYAHIPAKHAEAVNAFSVNELTPYLNYHRPCWFPETILDDKGRQRKRYPYKNLTTPYEKLKSLPAAEAYLKPGTTFKKLDAIAYRESDNDAARRLKKARAALFKSINIAQKSA
jgi:transposase InsO family protein